MGDMEDNMGTITLGIIGVFILGAILVLIGYLIIWLLNWIFQIAIPWDIQRLYIAIVFLVCLYYIVALLIGLPVPFRIWGER
jgi:hypothetical protein